MKVLWQHLLPRFWMTRLFGWLAEIRIIWIKNYFIRRFIRKYHIDLSISERTSIAEYVDFNDFFARKLQVNARPIAMAADALISPVDGFMYHYGEIREKPMFYAKGFEFSLEDLLVKRAYATLFNKGQFFCMYLSPNDYHRVHIPLTGRLLETTYVPGDYYSVNPTILAKIPGVFAKNERLICLFETEFGSMIYVMVGAMCVSSIYTIWAGRINAQRKGEIIETDYRQEKIYLSKGAELGHFQMGSTVMVFLPDKTINFDKNLAPGQHCLLGEKIANIAIKTEKVHVS